MPFASFPVGCEDVPILSDLRPANFSLGRYGPEIQDPQISQINADFLDEICVNLRNLRIICVPLLCDLHSMAYFAASANSRSAGSLAASLVRSQAKTPGEIEASTTRMTTFSTWSCTRKSGRSSSHCRGGLMALGRKKPNSTMLRTQPVPPNTL